MSTDPQTTETPAVDAAETTEALEQVTENLLVEDVSIDGMCGVY